MRDSSYDLDYFISTERFLRQPEIMGLCTKTNSRTSSNVDVFVDSKLCAFKSVIFIFTFIIYVMKLCDSYVLWMKY